MLHATRWTVGLVPVLLLVACTAGSAVPTDQETDDAGGRSGFAVVAPDDLTVLAAGSPEELALRTSETLFASAPAVVVVGPTSADRQRAMDLAAELGAPLVPAPPASPDPAPTSDETSDTSGTAASAAAAEVERLGATAAVAIGPDAAAWARSLHEVEVVDAAPGAGADALAADLSEALGAPYDELRAEPVTAVALVDRQTGDAALATATAQAAGATVAGAPGGDPRADPDTVRTLGEHPEAPVVVLGSGIAADRLAPLLAAARTGTQLPGGGQVVFPGRRLVALYGTPGAASLGVLGEQGVEASVRRARQVAGEYQDLTEAPVVPTFEIIATVATAAAGADGDYSREIDPETLRPWVDAAREAGMFVLLDLQPGRSDVLSQARRYEDLLREPHVGLALDPEWRLGPGERHLEQIGSLESTEVEAVADWLAGVVREHRLPQKVLVLHQFRLAMLPGRDTLDPGRDELAVVVHADGNGVPEEKLATWDALRAGAPAGFWWGWKNFYDEDSPTFTPRETYDLDPRPVLVSYQ